MAVGTINIPGGTHGHSGTGQYSDDGTYTDADMFAPNGYGYVLNFFNLVADFLTYLAAQLTSIAASVTSASGSATTATTEAGIATTQAGIATTQATNAAASAATAATQTTASSASSITLGVGTKTPTIDTGKGFIAGQWVLVLHDATHYEWGQVNSYTSGTGAFSYTVPSTAGAVVGSGTFSGASAWSVSVSGAIGPPGTPQPPDTLVTTNGTVCLINQVTAIDSSGGALTSISMPPTPTADGQWVDVPDQGGALAAFPVTVLHNGNAINGVADDVLLTIPNSMTRFVWRAALTTWQIEVR